MKRGGYLNRNTRLPRGKWKRSPSKLWTAIEKECPEIGKGILEAARYDEARAAKEWERKYGSVDRVLFVKHGLLCVRPNCYRSPCENHHIDGEGTGRKGHYTRIIPVCEDCHREWHAQGRETWLARYPDLDLEAEARWTDEQWLARGAEWVRTWREIRAAEQAVDLA